MKFDKIFFMKSALKHPRIVSFFLCLGILIYRAHERLTNPGFWGEDGSIFFIDALRNGWSTLFVPYEGYYHTLNRLFMLIFIRFPIEMIPLLITVLGFIIFAGVMSIFAKKDYDYLVPSDWGRVLIAGGFCIIPGIPEMLGNLCNLHRVFATWMLLLALLPNEKRFNRTQLAIAFLINGSAGEVLCFLPMFLYRIYLRSKNQGKLRSFPEEYFIIGMLISWSILNFVSRKTNTAPMTFDVFRILEGNLAALTFNFGIQPIVGWRLGQNLFHHANILFWIISSLMIFILCRDMTRKWKNDQFQIYLAVACLFATMELSWLVRPGDLMFFKGFYPSMWWGRTRMAYQLAFAGFLIWSFYFFSKSKKTGFAYLSLYFLLSDRLEIPSYGDFSHWPDTAKAIESSIRTGCPKFVHFGTFPNKWEVYLDSPVKPPLINCE